MGADDIVTTLPTVSNLVYNMAVAFGNVGTDVVGMFTSLLPALAPIVGAGVVARYGLRFIKRYSN